MLEQHKVLRVDACRLQLMLEQRKVLWVDACRLQLMLEQRKVFVRRALIASSRSHQQSPSHSASSRDTSLLSDEAQPASLRPCHQEEMEAAVDREAVAGMWHHDRRLWLAAQGNRDLREAWRLAETELKVCHVGGVPPGIGWNGA